MTSFNESSLSQKDSWQSENYESFSKQQFTDQPSDSKWNTDSSRNSENLNETNSFKNGEQEIEKAKNTPSDVLDFLV